MPAGFDGSAEEEDRIFQGKDREMKHNEGDFLRATSP